MTVDRNRLIVPFVAPIYDALWNAAYPIVRVTTGLFLIPHGAQKLFGAFGGPGLEATAGGFSKMGLEPGYLLALLAGGTEFFGGILLVLGLLTRVAAAGALILLLVAVFHVHLQNGFFLSNGGYEYALFWALMALVVFVRGGGPCSIDRKLGKEF
jgi:putative oxidoreductase